MSTNDDMSRPIQDPAALGLALRERRRELGLSQQQLAARIGVSRQWVVDLEGGKERAELGLVLRALRGLDMRVVVEPLGPAALDLDRLVDDA